MFAHIPLLEKGKKRLLEVSFMSSYGDFREKKYSWKILIWYLRLQTCHNSELKRGSYNRLKQGCTKSMIAQWCWIQLKIGPIFHEIFRTNHIWFWSLGSHESSASNRLQFKFEMRETWLIEVRPRKGYAIIGLSLGQIVFRFLGSIFGSLFMAFGLVGFFFFH